MDVPGLFSEDIVPLIHGLHHDMLCSCPRLKHHSCAVEDGELAGYDGERILDWKLVRLWAGQRVAHYAFDGTCCTNVPE